MSFSPDYTYFPRTVGEYINADTDAIGPLAEQPLSPIMSERELFYLFSVNTNELDALRLGLIPRSHEDPIEISEVHAKLLDALEIGNDILTLTNFIVGLTDRMPPGFLSVDGDGQIKKTRMGDVATALGGTLLRDFSIEHGVSIRNWVGLRQDRKRNKSREEVVSPQANRFRVFGSLLLHEEATAKEIADEHTALSYGNTTITLGQLHELGIVEKFQIKKAPPLFAWRFAEGKAELARQLFRASTGFILREPAAVESGLKSMDDLVNHPWHRRAIPALYKRSNLSSGHAARSELVDFNQSLLELFDQLDPTTKLTTKEIAQKLGITVTSQRMRRVVAKLGTNAAVTLEETADGKLFFTKRCPPRLNPRGIH